VNFIVENVLLIVIAAVSGGMLLWPLINKATAGAQLDTLAATRLMNDGAVVVDVRDSAEFSAGHLTGAKHIPVGDIAQRISDIPAGKPVLVYCATGTRSGKAASALKKAGRDQIFNLNGGIAAWRQAGLPTVK
jgi:rhodanese-related sulfurtransferase